MKVLELPKCPSCGSELFREFDLGNGSTLRKCDRCDTVFAPSFADPAEVYVDGYMFGEAGQFGLDVRDPEFQDHLTEVVGPRRLRIIEKATGIKGGTFLDVGCGTGEVLLSAHRRGWQVQGVEPERTGAEMTRDRGLPVINAYLEQSGVPEKSFDVVSAFHVLEHIPDSIEFLRLLTRWARPGGFIVIEVPNFNSSQRRRLRQDWAHYRPGEHLVHFTPATLKGTFERAGLVPVNFNTPTYIGPVQTLREALGDLGRYGRFRRATAKLNGGLDAHPKRYVWDLLYGLERLHNRAGAGHVVLGVSQVP